MGDLKPRAPFPPGFDPVALVKVETVEGLGVPGDICRGIDWYFRSDGSLVVAIDSFYGLVFIDGRWTPFGPDIGHPPGPRGFLPDPGQPAEPWDYPPLVLPPIDRRHT